MTERLTLTISAELDRDALIAYRDALAAKDAIDVYPGEPAEWRSMLDVVDLVNEDVLIRTELLAVTEGAPPLVLLDGAQKHGGALRRLVRRWRS